MLEGDGNHSDLALISLLCQRLYTASPCLFLHLNLCLSFAVSVPSGAHLQTLSSSSTDHHVWDFFTIGNTPRSAFLLPKSKEETWKWIFVYFMMVLVTKTKENGLLAAFLLLLLFWSQSTFFSWVFGLLLLKWYHAVLVLDALDVWVRCWHAERDAVKIRQQGKIW